jgi:hypothetical protein
MEDAWELCDLVSDLGDHLNKISDNLKDMEKILVECNKYAKRYCEEVSRAGNDLLKNTLAVMVKLQDEMKDLKKKAKNHECEKECEECEECEEIDCMLETADESIKESKDKLEERRVCLSQYRWSALFRSDEVEKYDEEDEEEEDDEEEDDEEENEDEQDKRQKRQKR